MGIYITIMRVYMGFSAGLESDISSATIPDIFHKDSIPSEQLRWWSPSTCPFYYGPQWLLAISRRLCLVRATRSGERIGGSRVQKLIQRSILRLKTPFGCRELHVISQENLLCFGDLQVSLTYPIRCFLMLLNRINACCLLPFTQNLMSILPCS